MAKAKKIAVKKAVTNIQLAPPAEPLPETIPLKVDTTDLKLLLIDLEALVQGPGTVDDRQKVVDRLKEIINKFDTPE